MVLSVRLREDLLREPPVAGCLCIGQCGLERNGDVRLDLVNEGLQSTALATGPLLIVIENRTGSVLEKI